MPPSKRESASALSSDWSVMDLTGFPFSPHNGQIASFATRVFAEANGSDKQQSDIGQNEEVLVVIHFWAGFRHLTAFAGGKARRRGVREDRHGRNRDQTDKEVLSSVHRSVLLVLGSLPNLVGLELTNTARIFRHFLVSNSLKSPPRLPD
jgi:hypothetical protein